ncbi:MAG: hypothetical protein O2856_19535, partial [Planctomycetota bacterium]|nr:hypothetical protein [Planctomycetota bacterium]
MDRLSILLEKLASGRLLVGSGDELKIRQVTKDEWTTIADALLKWWEATPNDLQKHQLSNLLTPIYARTLNEKHLPFLRRRVAEGPKDYEASYRQELYNAVLNQPWTEEIEAEAFALWPTMVPTEMIDQNGQKAAVLDSIRTAELVPKLYHLIDTMLQRRITASQQALQDKGHVDAATRTERTKSAADIAREAREGMASRLQKESDALGSEEEGKPDTLLRQWIIAERIYLDMFLDRNKGDVIKWAWAQLGDAPPKFVAPVEKEVNKVEVDELSQPTTRQQTNDIVTKQLDTLLKQRAWVTAMNLAARRNASGKLIERILAYIDAGIASGEEATTFVNGKLKEQGADQEELVDFTIGWRRTKYNALILFDRPDELVTALKQWIAKDKWNIPWRRALAKLYAEKGELKDAIAQMESVEKDDELTPEDYAAIADWYLVVDQREAYERSCIATYKAMQEWQLGQLLNQRNSEIAQGEGPHELDETTLFILKALFEKASRPSNYYGHVHNLYTSTRDFRLLEMVPESMLGHTKESVYASLSNLQSYLIQEVRNEAAADEILHHLHRLRDQINTGWVPRGADENARSLALDLRALDLMESMIERKASEVLNQPGPHGKAALTTFQRAFEQEWQDGERLLYARFLQQIGAVTHEQNNPILTPLADEQLRQMRQLYDDSKPASNDRVRIGLTHGQLLFGGYGRQQDGLTVLEAALNEFAAVHDGLIPYSHNDLVSAYSQMLQQMKQFVKAENYVQKHPDGLKNEGQRWTYIQHLNGLHQQALYERGRTSLGEDTTLLDNLLARLISQCDTKDDNQRHTLLSMIGNVFNNTIAHHANRIPTAKQKLLTFANLTLQELLSPQQNNYSSLVQHFSVIIHDRVDAL